ncbi:hypothetical protein LP52_18200 [Streptomonospora alba]|uniref:non-specific serine/threonine protein kinase n=1 Tax=Streptomonospora alba TaxID=183763 RepID=A0A0C2JLE2_9ACTN|nr:serine/threonine protein kinase [Streptomonospora alba]KIH97637.1 hypothetical protein LP52_18200 [Streptomonospora alba]
MAQILGGGPPVNDAERAAIKHLRDHGPHEWLVLHNVEFPIHGVSREIDLVVVTGHSVALGEVKGFRGKIRVAGRRWFPTNGAPFGSPVRTLRGHARSVKGLLERAKPALSRVYVDHLVVLTASNAVLEDPNNLADADANDVTSLAQLIPTLDDVSRVRTGMVRDLQPYGDQIIQALTGSVKYPTGPQRFGNWEVSQRLGGTEEVTEYRAKNPSVPTSETVLLRVYRADPFQPEDVRASERLAIANAYEVLATMPRSPYIVGQREFFPIEDESRFVLVLDDVGGESLQLLLDDPRRPLGGDTKLRIIHDILRGLRHAHGHRVLHRALSPAAVLVSGGGKAVLTGFDHARPEAPRDHTVVDRLADVLDPAYVAPECQDHPQGLGRASDVYAAGMLSFRILTGELPFTSSTDQATRRSELPAEVMEAAGVPAEVATLLQRMCALDPARRPSAADAAETLRRVTGAGGGEWRGDDSTPSGVDYRNLSADHQLTRKYTVRRQLGSGRFGTVYLVYDNLAAEDRAIKLVLRDRESWTERARQEYQVLLGLEPHPNVVRAENADYLPDGTPYLVFEYLDGKDVAEVVQERQLGAADALKLGIDIARGLVFLHGNGVFHCDVKPRNLMWTDQGGKIVDFNVAVTADSSMSRAGGTSRYAPPDMRIAGPPSAEVLTDRDVYGLALTLYQLVTGGDWPFQSSYPAAGEEPAPPSEHSGRGLLSEDLTTTLVKALSPLRGDRYASSAELLAALESVDAVHAPPPQITTPPSPLPPDDTNPFVAHLQSLYSQSPLSNAGTRGEDPYGLYVPTFLDTRLEPAVFAGQHRLVVVTGNAGDGKTAFLEHLVSTAREKHGIEDERLSANGAEVRLRSGLRLRTNHDGSQDEGEKANDEVLRDFFAPFAGDSPEVDGQETRLIAINEGRLVDFLTSHEGRFAWLAERIRAGLAGEPDADGVAVVNLNRRSVVADVEGVGGDHEAIFDRMLRRMTHERFWEACNSCALVSQCYAPHNARTLAHPSAGPQVTRRLKQLYELVHLRGHHHITVRDLRSALAFMLTSGRNCSQIRELYRGDSTEAIVQSFYFNSWLGPAQPQDRLLALLQDVDVAQAPDPALDRQLDYVGPEAGAAMMTVDQRDDYDSQLLSAQFDRLARGSVPGTVQVDEHRRYLASARRRFYFECVDDERARRLLTYRSAGRFREFLGAGDQVGRHCAEVVQAINRGEGLVDPTRLGDYLALQVRQVPRGTIRSYRLFPAEAFRLEVRSPAPSPYLEEQPLGLVLTYHTESGQRVELEIRLDLFELLERLRAGYIPGVADQQGLYLGLAIFKNELAAAPYQQILLTTGNGDLHRVTREGDGRLRMHAEEGDR